MDANKSSKLSDFICTVTLISLEVYASIANDDTGRLVAVAVNTDTLAGYQPPITANMGGAGRRTVIK